MGERRLQQPLVEQVGPQPGQAVFVFGCGSGTLAILQPARPHRRRRLMAADGGPR
jgi:precorrin-6B methylase 2